MIWLVLKDLNFTKSLPDHPYFPTMTWYGGLFHILISLHALFFIHPTKFLSDSYQVVSSFRIDDVYNIYKLSPPTIRLDDNFIREFVKENVEKEEV